MDKEGHFILLKWAISQKEITIINLYAPNVSAPNFINHTLKDLKAHIDLKKVEVGNFNTPLSTIDMSSRRRKKSTNPRPKQHHRSNVPN
jgi:hypothetical protein